MPTDKPAVSITFYDSDLDETEESDIETPEMNVTRKRLDSVDEETEEKCEILKDLLSDVGTIEPIGKKYLRLEFYEPKNIKFLDRNEDCDFDLNEEGYPFLPDSGEEYVEPFFKILVSKNPRFKNLTIETNSKNHTFKT